MIDGSPSEFVLRKRIEDPSSQAGQIVLKNGVDWT